MARVVFLALGLGLVAAAKPKADPGKVCSARSCDADGNCEQKQSTMLDAVGDMKPAHVARFDPAPDEN